MWKRAATSQSSIYKASLLNGFERPAYGPHERAAVTPEVTPLTPYVIASALFQLRLEATPGFCIAVAFPTPLCHLPKIGPDRRASVAQLHALFFHR